jgi:hypothetical protein
MKENALEQDLIREWIEGEPIVFSLDRCNACAIVGALQLALRHPGLAETKGAAPIVREFIRQIFERSGPATRRAILLGSDPENDW